MPHTVLIIEDEPSIADTLRYALTKEGFEVDLAPTGAAGLAIIERGTIALAILDVGLPDRNGFEILREIRGKSKLPILMLTARTEELDRVLGLELGADDYVTKPFSPREVVARVRAILKRCESSSAPAPADRRFVVDGERFLISFHGHPLELSRYEYRMLALMVKRPGWVFSRERLMELCWESPEASMERTVDTHIKTLRTKLRAVRPDEETIRTHRGVGYSLSEGEGGGTAES